MFLELLTTIPNATQQFNYLDICDSHADNNRTCIHF